MIEIHAAHKTVRQVICDTFLLEQTGLGICTVEDRVVLPRTAFFYNIPYHPFCLIKGGTKLPEYRSLAHLILRPERLIFTSGVVLDHLVRGIQDHLRGTVILLQFDHLCARECLLKTQDIFDIGAAEPVDRLVIISHDTDVAVFRRKQADQLKLHRICILVLVHHDIAEAVLIILQDLLLCLEELDRLYEEIIEIQGIILFQAFLILHIEFPDPLESRITVGLCA